MSFDRDYNGKVLVVIGHKPAPIKPKKRSFAARLTKTADLDAEHMASKYQRCKRTGKTARERVNHALKREAKRAGFVPA